MGGSVPSAKPHCSRSTAGSTRHSPTSSSEPWGTACMSSQRAVASCTLPHLQRMDPMPACAARLSPDSMPPAAPACSCSPVRLSLPQPNVLPGITESLHAYAVNCCGLLHAALLAAYGLQRRSQVSLVSKVVVSQN